MLYNVDLSQAENRIVAYIAPDLNMIQAFESKMDIHKKTAGLLFGKPAEEISDVDGSSTIGGGRYSERFWGKKCNHSLNYDMGYKSFALITEISEGEAKFIVERYHAGYPGVRQYHAWVRAQMSKDRTLTNPFGRRRRFLDRWGDQLFKEAYSWIPQSTVADKINAQGINYMFYNQHWFAPVEILNQVHDSIVFQIADTIPFETHAECLCRLRDSLQTPVKWRDRDFVIPADLAAGRNLSKNKKDKLALKGVDWNGLSDVRGLAGRLYDLYEQFGAASTI